MSKQVYTNLLIRGLVFVSVLLCITSQASQADTNEEFLTEVGSDSQTLGRVNPFQTVEPKKPLPKQVVASVTSTGITPVQLQEAIQAAIKASNSNNNAKQQIAPAAETEPVKVVPERHIKSVMLKFLRAANVLPVVSNMLTEYGSAAIDEETNTLLICDDEETLDKIIRQIAKADKTPQQILVEVVIVDVQLSNDTELGVNWDNLFADADGFLGSVSYVQQLNDLTTGGSLTMIKGRVENTVKALQKERHTEILASPRVLVLSGQEAKLETIEEIPYTDLTLTGQGGGVENPIASTEFKNAGITLTVKPTVTDEGRIMIEVQPDQSINTGVAGVGSTNVPIVDRRTVKTTLLMEQGDVAVIGGLRSKDVRISQDKIPVLGDIPLIGGFFSNDKEVEENSELLIIISPRVYNHDDDLKDREKALWDEVNSLKNIRLRRKVRPEQQMVKKVIPQNKPKKI